MSALLSRLVKSGYLTANAASMVTPLMKLPALKMNIGRTFDEAQWQWVMQCWSEMYLQVGPIAEGEEQPLLPDAAHPDRHFQRAAELRRTRLLLELGATTGMRRIEICTTRRRALERVVVEGEPVWIAKVIGKGNKEREVLLFDDVKALLDQHHRDMASAGTDYDPSSTRRRELLNPMALSKPKAGALPCPVQADGLPADVEAPPETELVRLNEDEVRRGLPLIGALRKAPRRRTLDKRGLVVLDDEARNADVHGSLDPTAMAQAFRRFLQACAAMGRAAGVEIDIEKLERGTPHFLRHTFANNAAADGVLPVALMGALGHSSLEVTSPYLHPERKLIVSEMSRMRRRT